MTTVLRHQQRAGRFGREIGGDDTTKATGLDAGESSEIVGYAIDEHAVAEAIVERLRAGRSFVFAPAR